MLIEHFVDLPLVRPEPCGEHKPFDPDTRVAIAIARMAHLAVMVMAKTLALGKVPDAPLTDAIQCPIRMYSLQMHTLGLAGFDPRTPAAFGPQPFGGKQHGHDSTQVERLE
jgi:hypothetical protein